MPECLKEMRQQAEQLDEIYYVYVIDDENRLQGVFPLKKMITSPSVSWLIIGMLGGIGNSMILGNFDATFAAHPEMALYIPLIGGTGGNVGTQSSAIIVQGLANNSLDAKDTFKQITKESVVALINATIISLLVYIYNFVRFGACLLYTSPSQRD